MQQRIPEEGGAEAGNTAGTAGCTGRRVYSDAENILKKKGGAVWVRLQMKGCRIYRRTV